MNPGLPPIGAPGAQPDAQPVMLVQPIDDIQWMAYLAILLPDFEVPVAPADGSEPVPGGPTRSANQSERIQRAAGFLCHARYFAFSGQYQAMLDQAEQAAASFRAKALEAITKQKAENERLQAEQDAANEAERREARRKLEAERTGAGEPVTSTA
ncbi:MAG TPA: hypothetical protein VJN95_08630 [Gemmatimonadales bacterium]|nr:hypothetical protein [Gemmatimonadales bacterium]